MKRLFLLPIVIAVTTCLSSAQSVENATVEREEYAVYSAIVPEYYHNLEGGIMVIANPTWRYPHEISRKSLRFLYPAPVVSQETLDDFLQRNKTDRWLTRKFQLDFAYIIANSMEIKSLIGDNPISDWKEFFKQYPASHGFFRCSRVGFNQSVDQALVYVGWSCPGLCGQWELNLLIKKDGLWKVVNSANRMVS